MQSATEIETLMQKLDVYDRPACFAARCRGLIQQQ